MVQAKLNDSFSEESSRPHKNVGNKPPSVKVLKPKKKSAESLGEMAARLRAHVPPEEWDKLPTDLARNVDHYLYGAKKVS